MAGYLQKKIFNEKKRPKPHNELFLLEKIFKRMAYTGGKLQKKFPFEKRPWPRNELFFNQKKILKGRVYSGGLN